MLQCSLCLGLLSHTSVPSVCLRLLQGLTAVGGSMMMCKYREIAALTHLRSLTLSSECGACACARARACVCAL